ncbi:WhiB family transcriptional regulator [Streptomyces sp. CNQ085]|uniref:WhiB family transcriptional regulator n=1 Tax=Streptomyces sp. CNQ085 TaxID=2886944 RepID=UPI001F50BDBD|nr:WhiB family transcriptional regulator [Streptomyces sp. CNQ085]MCI0386399.1 WhiB family transcriptional regulator [Streptomyces sp. CNQ085]
MGWRESAACRGEDPELFFPIGDGGLARQQTARARAVCLGCPVMPQCRDWAVRSGETEGVWGGTTAAERRLIRRGFAGRLPEG